MRDFLDAHSHTKSAKPKISRSRPSIPALAPKPATPKPSGPPEWLSDFAPDSGSPAPAPAKAPAKASAPAPTPAPRTQREKAAPEPNPKQKPDWMKDFE